MNYKVLKPFYKHSNKQSYSIGEIVDFSTEAMLKEGYLEATKSKEVTKKEVIETPKEEASAKISTKDK